MIRYTVKDQGILPCYPGVRERYLPWSVWEKYGFCSVLQVSEDKASSQDPTILFAAHLHWCSQEVTIFTYRIPRSILWVPYREKSRNIRSARYTDYRTSSDTKVSDCLGFFSPLRKEWKKLLRKNIQWGCDIQACRPHRIGWRTGRNRLSWVRSTAKSLTLVRYYLHPFRSVVLWSYLITRVELGMTFESWMFITSTKTIITVLTRLYFDNLWNWA